MAGRPLPCVAPDPGGAADRPRRGLARIAAWPILAWRYGVSPVIGPRCRFHPSCSEYGLQALARHGAVGGVWLTARRLARCHPWHPGGLDPVPDAGDPPSIPLARTPRGGHTASPDLRRPPTPRS